MAQRAIVLSPEGLPIDSIDGTTAQALEYRAVEMEPVICREDGNEREFVQLLGHQMVEMAKTVSSASSIEKGWQADDDRR